MTTINTQLLENLGLNSPAQTAKGKETLGQSDFLELMTTQGQDVLRFLGMTRVLDQRGMPDGSRT